jgi:Uma2 family endonuclease
MQMLTRVEVAERMSNDEFLRYTPEAQKAELIDGVMIIQAPPIDTHERLRGFLLSLLGMFIEQRDLGEIRGSRTPVILAEGQVFEPDILFVARERSGLIKERGVFGAPDLVIEILSASTAPYDRDPKLRAYELAAVPEVWLIDPHGPLGTEFFQRQAGRLEPVMPDAQGVVRSVGLPSFALQVAWLWPAERFLPIAQALREIETL